MQIKMLFSLLKNQERNSSPPFTSPFSFRISFRIPFFFLLKCMQIFLQQPFPSFTTQEFFLKDLGAISLE